MKRLVGVASLIVVLGLIISNQATLFSPAYAETQISQDALLFEKLSQSPNLQRIAKNLNWTGLSKNITTTMQNQALEDAAKLSQDEVFAVIKMISETPMPSEYKEFPGIEELRNQEHRRILGIVSELYGDKGYFSLSPEEMRKVGDVVETDSQLLQLSKKTLELKQTPKS